MKISEIKQLDANLKGFIAVGKVFWIGEVENKTNKSNGETFTTQSIGISDGNNRKTDSIFVELSNGEKLTDDVKGKTISCISCKINDWQGKRNLRASNFSFDVIPANDPAHPELPPTKTIPNEETQAPAQTYTPPAKKEEIQPSVWSEKDLKIVRQHETSDAVALVCKFFKGTLEEAIAKTILVSNMLVENVYQGLAHPIKKKTQAELLNEIKADSDRNVADAAENVKSLNNTSPTEEGDLI